MYKISTVPTDNLGKVAEISLDWAQLKNTVLNLNWSASQFISTRRHKSDFKLCNVIGLDIDEGMTIDRAKAILEGFKHIIAPSRSHQVEKNGKTVDRFRVLIFLSTTITDNTAFKHTWNKLNEMFEGALDPATKDSSRFFYSSKSIYSESESGKLIDPIFRIEEVKEIQREFKKIEKLEKKTFVNPNQPSLEDKLRKLHPSSLLLLSQNPPEDGKWHNTMLLLWGSMKNAGLTKDEAIETTENYLSKHGMSLDSEHDIKQIETIFSTWENRFSQKPGVKKTQVQIFIEHKTVLAQMISGTFAVSEVTSGTSNTRMIVEYIGSNEVRQANEDQVASYYAKQVVGTELENTADHYLRLVEGWAMDFPALPEPRIVSINDRTAIAFKHVEIDISHGPTPLFDNILNAMNNQQAFKAFLWSIFDEQSYNQQMLLWYGGGGNGKTSLINLISELLGQSVLNTSSKAAENTHFTESLIGKRLLLFGDENNFKFVMNGTVKKLTGDDQIYINPKGKTGYSIKLPLKVVIISNHEPEFDTMNANRRRLILCPFVEKVLHVDDPYYIQTLRNEIPHILYKCRQAYDQLCPKHGMIPCDYKLVDAIAQSASNKEKKTIEKYIEFSKQDFVPLSVFTDFFEHPSRMLNKADIRSLKSYLQNLHNIFLNTNEDGVAGFVGIKLKKS